MHSGNWDCPLVKCTWAVPPAEGTNTEAMHAFAEHLHDAHHVPRNGVMAEYNKNTKGYAVDNGVPISILARVEIELDSYIKTALEWPEPEGGIWDSNEVAKLRNQLEKAKATAAGRGLAIALWHMRGEKSVSNPFKSPDHVIRDAVERYKNPVPDDSEMGISPTEQVAETSPAPKITAKLTDNQREKIKGALDGGFDAKQLSTMFKVSLAEIEGCR